MQNLLVFLRRKMPDFTDMLSKAKEMQAKMKDAQDIIKNIEVILNNEDI